jgi:hypothetical protein
MENGTDFPPFAQTIIVGSHPPVILEKLGKVRDAIVCFACRETKVECHAAGGEYN